MAQTASIAAREVVEFLTAPDTGVGAGGRADWRRTPGVALAPIPPAHIVNQNMPVALAEQAIDGEVSGGACVLGSRAESADREIPDVFGKSADGGGSAGVAGSDRGNRGATAVVRGRGDAGAGCESRELGARARFTRGGYEVTFEPVQHGGRNFCRSPR